MSLTKDWKEGRLPEGFYYVKCPWSKEVEIRYVHNNSEDEWEEVVASIPSYDDLAHIETRINWQDKRIKELKELLKECVPLLDIKLLTGNKKAKNLLTRIETIINKG